MADSKGLATFPGVSQVVEASITVGHGITPSSASLACAPQPNFAAAGGTLSFLFAGKTIKFPDCKVFQHNFSQDGGGQKWSLSILDRRWKWSEGVISGEYNLRADDGSLDSDRERPPQQLAQLLLQAMGEQDFDVSQLPNDSRPLVQWDHDNPAKELAQLCELLGCRVVLRLDNSVLLAQTGQGMALPIDKTTILSNSQTIDPPQVPDSFMVVGAKTRYQGDYLLTAVGLDLDGTVKQIDKLSYKPAAGWGLLDLPNFRSVSSPQAQELAKATVFRWYRIISNADGSQPTKVPGYGTLKNGFQILPIEDEQVTTFTDPGPAAANVIGAAIAAAFNPLAGAPALGQALGNQANKKGNLPAQIVGTWYNGRLGCKNTDPNTLCDRPFRIIKDRAIVEFAQYVHKFSFAGQNNAGKPNGIAPADLVLRVACSVRDPDTWAWKRYEKTKPTGGQWQTGPHIIKNEELALTYVGVYSAQGKLVSVQTNKATVDAKADAILTAAVMELQTKLPQDIKYGGIRDDIDLDGAIHQITFSVGPSGATTRAGRNNEFDESTKSYWRRRLDEQLRGGGLNNLDRKLDEVGRLAVKIQGRG